jgi:copper chaperone CopZ
MRHLTILFALLLAGALSVQAQSQKACCAGKKKACAKEASAKKACCDKKEKGKSCAKMEGKAEASASSVRTAAAGDDFVKVATIRIYGNCGMCKRTIEGALKDVDGINEASWDVSTGMLSVAYAPEQVNEDDIKAKVAAVGYDSDTHRAPDEVYDALHACCQYDRPKG